jgi:hypothetical protein
MSSSRLRAVVAGTAVLLLVAAPAYANQAPNALPDSVTTPEDTAVTIVVTANDSDPDGDTVVLALNAVIQAPAHGTASRVSSTSIRYTPHANYFGSDTFRYRIHDGNGAVDSALVTVTVSEVNDKPVANPDAASTTEEVAVTVNVTANDTDVDGDTVTLITSPIVTAPAHGTAVKVSGSSIRYTPHPNFFGSDTFQYEAGDGRGKRARAWVTISVAGVNDPPNALPDSVTTNEDTAVTIAVTANDSDPDGDTLNVLAILEAPSHGTAVKVSSSSIRYTPHANYSGSDTFRYRIGDGNGAVDSALVTVTVVEVNDPPVAVDDAASTQPGEPVAIVVTANDSDVDGDTVRLITNPVVTAPVNGTAVKLSGTTIEYTPDAGFKGDDTFQYEVGDGRGARSRATVTVTVINQPPVAAADTATAHVGTPTVIDVTANDSDPDGDTVVLIGSPIVTPASHGSAVKVSGCCVEYTSAAGYLGQDTFQYEVGDGHGGRSRAWVTVTVSNQPPTAAADSATTIRDQAVSIDVVANDVDPDGDPLALTADSPISAPLHGTAVRISDTTLRYTPSTGYLGDDSFTYRVADPYGGTATATVAVTVQEPAPVVQDELRYLGTLGKGAVNTVTVIGQNLAGAQVSVARDPDDPSRAYPWLTIVGGNAAGTTLKVEIDASNTAVEGFYTLLVEKPSGAESTYFRVVPPSPVVDAWSPSQIGVGSVYALTVSGANLAGAAVSITAPGVQIIQLDNSDDEFLSGLLHVPDGGGVGLGELVIDNAAGSRRLPLQVVAAASATSIQSKNIGQSPSGPPIYLQEPSFSDEMLAMEGGGVVPKGADWCITFSRHHRRSNTAIFILLFDELTGEILDRGVLERLAPGAVVPFGVQVGVFYRSIEVSLVVNFCSDGSDGALCIRGDIGAFIVGIGGQGFRFDACVGFHGGDPYYDISASASGLLFNASWSSSNACFQASDLVPDSQIGIRSARLEVCEDGCSTERAPDPALLTLHLGGILFETPFNFSVPMGNATLSCPALPPGGCVHQGAVNSGSLVGDENLPHSGFPGYEGTGYYYYASADPLDTDNWTCRETTSRAIGDVGFLWPHRDTGVLFGVGDISLHGGGRFPPHASHQNGLDVDVRYLRVDGARQPLDLASGTSNFDRVKTQELIDLYFSLGAELIIVDPRSNLTGTGISYDSKGGHSNHFHVRFPDPDGFLN